MTQLYTYSLSYFFHHSLSQNNEYISLCCTVGLYCLSILHLIVYMICISLIISDIDHPQLETSQQRKVQDQMVSLVNSTKCLKKC